MNIRKKLNSTILSVRDFKEGVEGIIGEQTFLTNLDGEKVLNKHGKPLMTIDLADIKSGEVKKFWLDGGLRGSLKMAKVMPGMKVALVHTGEKDIDDGYVQTYDVFGLE